MKPKPYAWITGTCIVSVKLGTWDCGNQPNTTTVSSIKREKEA